MNGFSRLAFVETKLFLREKAATSAVFGLPVAFVIAVVRIAFHVPMPRRHRAGSLSRYCPASARCSRSAW